MSYKEWDAEAILAELGAEEVVDGSGPGPEGDTSQQAKRLLKKNVSFAVQSIIWLARYGEPRMRYDASRYIIERVLGKSETSGLDTKVDSNIESLLEQMQEEMTNG